MSLHLAVPASCKCGRYISTSCLGSLYRLSALGHQLTVLTSSQTILFYMFSALCVLVLLAHDDVMKWKHFPRYWSFVRGIHKGLWRRALLFSLICTWIICLSKQWWGWWFETPSRRLWRHCNVMSRWQPSSHVTSWHENAFRITGHLWVEFNGDRWIPPQRAYNAGFDYSIDVSLNNLLTTLKVVSDFKCHDAHVTILKWFWRNWKIKYLKVNSWRVKQVTVVILPILSYLRKIITQFVYLLWLLLILAWQEIFAIGNYPLKLYTWYIWYQRNCFHDQYEACFLFSFILSVRVWMARSWVINVSADFLIYHMQAQCCLHAFTAKLFWLSWF